MSFLYFEFNFTIGENAVQHAKGMTELFLRVFTIGTKAIFEVKDNGEGIDAEKLRTLFTTFAQSDSETDGTTHSMGIGLAVCATIIHAHGGSISAKNAKNGGALFRFSLNLEETDEQQIEIQKSSSPRQNLTSWHF